MKKLLLIYGLFIITISQEVWARRIVRTVTPRTFNFMNNVQVPTSPAGRFVHALGELLDQTTYPADFKKNIAEIAYIVIDRKKTELEEKYSYGNVKLRINFTEYLPPASPAQLQKDLAKIAKEVEAAVQSGQYSDGPNHRFERGEFNIHNRDHYETLDRNNYNLERYKELNGSLPA